MSEAKTPPKIRSYNPETDEETLTWEDRKSIDIYSRLSNGYIAFCETCNRIHLVQINDDGTHWTMGACGAWSWKSKKPWKPPGGDRFDKKPKDFVPREI